MIPHPYPCLIQISNRVRIENKEWDKDENEKTLLATHGGNTDDNGGNDDDDDNSRRWRGANNYRRSLVKSEGYFYQIDKKAMPVDKNQLEGIIW